MFLVQFTQASELPLIGQAVGHAASLRFVKLGKEGEQAAQRNFQFFLAVRLRDLRARGVSFRAGQTLRDLYDERCPLYERYAHGVLDCDGLKPGDVVAGLAALKDCKEEGAHT